mmetsp:Transcript_1107/g.3154  ORF Transcript_1107/g.3154 Transcript_1107/m.3154 type:complete len:290 (-) Transcript_1107:72-941(-)
MAPATPARRMPRGARLGAALVATAALGVALPALKVPGLARQDARSWQLNEEEPAGGVVAGFLEHMSSAVEPLRKQVDGGTIVSKFGQKAEGVVASTAAQGGAAGPELARAVDGLLHTLFLRQLSMLRQQLAAKFEKDKNPVEAVAKADTEFVAQAQDLVRPGSSWSFDAERYALRAVLEGTFQREHKFAEERLVATQTQQATVEIIAKLQSQMEALQSKVQAMRAGSPWFLSSAYRIPGTPFQLIGRYQQGRANFELSLNPDKDPANADAGFVQGIGPANLGVGLNVGL